MRLNISANENDFSFKTNQQNKTADNFIYLRADRKKMSK